MLEILFVLAFTLHNIEEGIWLPRWSKHIEKYHPRITNNEFHFALIAITTCGYLLTFLFLMYGQPLSAIGYIYTGFLLMMCLNTIFPHLLATIILRKYAPGTLTGLLLNLPIGMVVIIRNVNNGLILYKLFLISAIIVIVTMVLLRLFFKLGGRLIEAY